MSKRRGNPKAGAAGLLAFGVVVALCCGALMGLGDDDEEPARPGPAPVQVVEETTPAAPVQEPVEEPQEVPEPDVDEEEDDGGGPQVGVHPGAFCEPEGARGVTDAGTAMECKGPGRARWRRA